MIVHHPYGNDDPYKRTPTERFPRDPKPGERVQIGFRGPAGLPEAWVDVSAGGANRRVEAQSLGEGLWTADLGSFPSGRVTYVIRAAPGGAPAAAEFTFDIGVAQQVVGIGTAVQDGAVLRVELATDGLPAFLELSFPLAGTCHAQLVVGGEKAEATGSSPAQAARSDRLPVWPEKRRPFTVEEAPERLVVRSDEIVVVLDRTTLAWTAFLPDANEPTFHGSVRFTWWGHEGGSVSSLAARFDVGASERLYGLGERFVDPERNGDVWDVRVYEEYKEQGKRTYLPMPFLLSERNYGVWFDVDEPSLFDLRGQAAEVTVEKLVDPREPRAEVRLPVVVFVKPRAYDVTAAFTALTGPIAVPPKWAFAPWMSDNTWNDQARATEVLERTIAENVPAGVMVLEAWSDESTFYIFNDAEYDPMPGDAAPRLADFRFGGRWPDPKAFVDACHAAGVRVVLWQIPVSKRLEAPHAQHDQDEAHMLKRGFAIANEDGSPYRNRGWWFPEALVVDFTNPEADAWWFAKRRYLLDELGIDGMTTDGGEHLWGRYLRSHDGRRGLELFNTYANFYVGAYHRFVQEATGGDGVTFSRAGYTGAQAFPAHWAGDEDSTWSAYRASVRAGLSAGIGGVSMWSWDIGGFSGDTPGVELYLRSTAMATFSPIMQYHAESHGASDRRDRTPWNVAERHRDARALDVYREYAQLRMRLLDYLYDEAVASSAEGKPLMRYPALEHPEAAEFLIQDPYVYLFGRDLLVAPVVDKGVETRPVRLPPGAWIDVWSGARFEGPAEVLAPAPIERIPVYVRGDSPRAQRVLDAVRASHETDA
jgi:alpha-glucosidase (family GH31 glycosyl hydrolase)